MAKKDTTKTKSVERPNRLVSRIIRSTNARSKKDIQQWRVALQQAENIATPKRTLLYNIYNEISLDAHLSAEIERRLNAVLSSQFELFDTEGSPLPEASALLRKKWLRKFIQYSWESILWGNSLIEIDSLTPEGLIADVRLINRWHVRPETGIVVVNQADDKGIDYREDKKYAPWLFEVGDIDNLGLLNKCIPHVIFKRFAQSAYSEYCEVLGIPPRVLKTKSFDTEHLNRSEDMLANMSTNSYAVIGEDEEITFVNPGASDGTIFTNLFRISSNEISKLIGGAIVGEDSQQGSRAKEQVSLELTKTTIDADKQMITGIINDYLLPRLIELGYPFADATFEFNQEKNLKEELDNALRIAQQFEMDQEGIDYMNKTFGVPVVKQKAQPSFGGVSPEGNATAKDVNDFFG